MREVSLLENDDSNKESTFKKVFNSPILFLVALLGVEAPKMHPMHYGAFRGLLESPGALQWDFSSLCCLFCHAWLAILLVLQSDMQSFVEPSCWLRSLTWTIGSNRAVHIYELASLSHSGQLALEDDCAYAKVHAWAAQSIAQERHLHVSPSCAKTECSEPSAGWPSSEMSDLSPVRHTCMLGSKCYGHWRSVKHLQHITPLRCITSCGLQQLHNPGEASGYKSMLTEECM